MRKLYQLVLSGAVAIAAIALHSCRDGQAAPSKAAIDAIDLKRGPVISCGAPGRQYGSLTFETSCPDSIKPDFELAIEMLHSFEYDEAEKVFARVIDKSPDCAMAYWGVAMCNFHALWSPPTEEELIKGNRAIAVAQSIRNKTAREAAYIDALAAFYGDWQHKDHMTRCNAFEQAMGKIHTDYPADKEAAIFYALSLDAAAIPTDKSYAKQKKAGAILEALYPGEPNHPGVIHYIIHSYDYPGLAIKALPAAEHYAEVAPSSAHALHMPSHIFTRLGMWDECIRSNQASVSSARCYAEATGIKGHWDEEMHGLDYIIYAWLQKGRDDSARMELRYLDSIRQVSPMNFKVAFAFAAIPSRYVLENHYWKEAAALSLQPSFVPWKNFPWQEAMVRY
ncbi:MAG: hypothetical protein JST39_00225, partial [Bacteroidetes bacterium]|nr:hypothetical protein [Bacteroidota bacterium]